MKSAWWNWSYRAQIFSLIPFFPSPPAWHSWASMNIPRVSSGTKVLPVPQNEIAHELVIYIYICSGLHKCVYLSISIYIYIIYIYNHIHISGLHAIPESYTSLVGVECIAIMVHSVIPMIPVPAGSSAAFSQADLKSSRDTKKSAKIAMKQLLWAPNTKNKFLWSTSQRLTLETYIKPSLVWCLGKTTGSHTTYITYECFYHNLHTFVYHSNMDVSWIPVPQKCSRLAEVRIRLGRRRHSGVVQPCHGSMFFFFFRNDGIIWDLWDLMSLLNRQVN